MRLSLVIVACAFLLPLVGFTHEVGNRYISASFLHKVPPELTKDEKAITVNAAKDLQLSALKGRMVLLMFTSTG